MILTIILGIITLIVSVVCTFFFRIPGMDLTPIGMVILAQNGENALIGAIVLSIAYKLPKPSRLIWIWVQVPVALVAGWMALTFDMVILPIIVYYILSLGFGVISGTVRGRYYISVVFGFCLNLVVGRMYTFWR